METHMKIYASAVTEFNGGSDVEGALGFRRFEQEVEEAEKILFENKWAIPPTAKLTIVKKKLGSEPFQLLLVEDDSVLKIHKRLETYYLSERIRANFKLKADTMVQEKGERNYDFCKKLITMLRLWDRLTATDEYIIQYLRMRVSEKIFSLIKSSKPADVASLMNDILEIDQFQTCNQLKEEEGVNQMGGWRGRGRGGWRGGRGRGGWRGRSRGYNQQQRQQQQQPFICNYCHQPNHRAADCVLRKRNDGYKYEKKKEEVNQVEEKKNEECEEKGKSEMWEEYEVENKYDSDYGKPIFRRLNWIRPTIGRRRIRSSYIMKKLKLGNVVARAMIDTGCTTSVIGNLTADKLLRNGAQRREVAKRMSVANGQSIFIQYEVISTMTIDGVPFKLKLLVMPQLKFDMILGMNTLDLISETHKCRLDIEEKSMSIKSKENESKTVEGKSERDVGEEERCGNMSRRKGVVETFQTVEDLKKYFYNKGPPKKVPCDIEMRIDLKTNISTVAKARGWSINEEQRIKKCIEALVIEGKIRLVNPADTRYKTQHLANCLVTNNKGKSKDRLVVDYSLLNFHTKKIAYPYPKIRDLLRRLTRKGLRTVIDLARAFWQIQMAKESIHMTRFRTPFGIYEWLVMPMGLSNSPAIFQQYVDFALQHLVAHNCALYRDDILIASDGNSETAHDAKVADMLDALWNAGLPPNWDKLQFRKNVVRFCGYFVSDDGIRAMPEKYNIIKDIKPPKTMKQLRSFMGLCNHFREFIPKYDTLAAPINNKLSGFRISRWMEDELVAFDRLKTALQSPQVLHSPKDMGEFHCYTDASKVAAGWAIYQVQDNVQRLIKFGGKKFTKPQTNYGISSGPMVLPETMIGTPMQELLAIYLACKDLLPLALGFDVIIHTDHIAWTNLHKIKSNPMVMRWLYKIQLLNPLIEHIEGRKNLVADAISRMNFDANGKPMNEEQMLHMIYVLTDEKLHIIKDVHEQGVAHLGIRKTFDKLKERFNWPGIYADTVDVVNSCVACQKFKNNRRKDTRAKMTPIVAKGPFDIVGIDLFDVSINKKPHHILAFIDYFSRWLELVHMPATNAKSIVNTLKNLFNKFSVPNQIISDGGPQLTGLEMERFLDEYFVKHGHSSIDHQQANGMVERAIGTVIPLIDIQIAEGAKWPELLDIVTKAMNNTIHVGMSSSPFKIIHGFIPRTATDNKLDRLAEDQRIIVEQAAIENRDSKIDQTSHYNKKKNAWNFEVKDKVFVKNFYRTLKSHPRFLGPYEILEKLRNNNYLISLYSKKSGKPLRVNCQFLKPFLELKYQIRDDSTHRSKVIIQDDILPLADRVVLPPTKRTVGSVYKTLPIIRPLMTGGTPVVASPAKSVPPIITKSPIAPSPPSYGSPVLSSSPSPFGISSPAVSPVSAKVAVISGAIRPNIGARIKIFDARKKEFFTGTVANQFSQSKYGVNLDDHPSWEPQMFKLAGPGSKTWSSIDGSGVIKDGETALETREEDVTPAKLSFDGVENSQEIASD